MTIGVPSAASSQPCNQTNTLARTAWSGGGAHFVAIAGFIEGDLIEVHDPISGVSDVDYDVFVTSYQGSGSWTHSYFTRS